MASWKNVNIEAQAVFNSHGKLNAVFDSFANHVAKGLNPQDGYFKGLEVELQLQKNLFFVSVAGRTVAFNYKTIVGNGMAVSGRVIAYLKSGFPKEDWTQIGEFSFDSRGKTDQEDDEDRQFFYLDSDLSSTCVAMYFVNLALKN